MRNHMLWMIIGCTLPLLLIFVLPALGVRSDNTLFLAVILMFGAHLLMLGGSHGDHEGGKKAEGRVEKHANH